MHRHDHVRRVRGFTLIEVLVAIAITGLMIGAVMVALDTCFKGYKVTTEQSATNMMARLTMQRISSLVRNAKDFAPLPQRRAGPDAEPRPVDA
jgi:prepilin-type N-terminal cleavage/methylation domain-containing protein